MKLIVCYVPLLVLLLVHDSMGVPGPKPALGFGDGFSIHPEAFLDVVRVDKPLKPPVINTKPIIKNSTTIGGIISGHSGNNNAAQANNSINLKQAKDD